MFLRLGLWLLDLLLATSEADPAPPPYFWQSQFIFLHCIQCLKNIFEIEFDFIVAEIRRGFGSVGGVCMCVCLCDPIGLHDKSVVFYLISVGFRNLGRCCFELYPRPFLS